MRKKPFYLITIFLLHSILLLTSCKEEEVEYRDNNCKRQPAFVKSTGLDVSRVAFSTTETRQMGLQLIENSQSGQSRRYQHPSWKMAGWVGPILVDPQGNCFVGPIPVISLLNNPTSRQNIIYRVDGNTGEMKPFVELPVADSISVTNPYGILGFAYLCETNTLYVSTVQGSDRRQEKGCIYAVDGLTGKIIDKHNGLDVLGMGISYISGKRKLYFGSARNSAVYSITLNKNGKFSGNRKFEFSLDDLGPRGDDKVRRIRFEKMGQMQVYAVEFDFNLTAPSERQETIYTWYWNDEEKKWMNFK
ncbi:MAG: hypothetical protein WBC06_14410 [Chitinophagaceae bacterium]